MRKSDQEKSEIRRQIEARRRPEKDRSAHEAARGKKKMSLSDLSRNDIQDEHIQDIIHELDHQSDRGAALVAATLVDISLRRLMRTRFANFEDFEKIVFDGEAAPLGNFSARIKLARAMGVVGSAVEDHLNRIRRIRNQFAHSALKIDFQHPLIAAEIEGLLDDDGNGWKPEFTVERRRYIGTSIALIVAMERELETHLQDMIPIWLDYQK